MYKVVKRCVFMQNYIPQSQIINNQTNPPQPYATQPQVQGGYPAGGVPQNGCAPSCSAVNIQIFNPTAGSPNGYFYPQQTASAYSSGTQGGCYAPGYYTAGGYNNPYANGLSGYYDQNGVFHPTTPNNTPVQTAPVTGTTANTSASNTSEKISSDTPKASEKTTPANGDASQALQAKSDKTSDNTPETDKEKSLQDTNNKGDSSKTANADDGVQSNTHKEKRNIVILTDDYLRTLENYLNSQDLEVRKMGAREVVARLEEDPSRKDDPALTALVNKMLQDPATPIRAIALSIVESQTLHGDELTATLLKQMQTSSGGYGQDAIQATSALLKMAGKQEEKVIEVPNKKSSQKPDEKKSDK